MTAVCSWDPWLDCRPTTIGLYARRKFIVCTITRYHFIMARITYGGFVFSDIYETQRTCYLGVHDAYTLILPNVRCIRIPIQENLYYRCNTWMEKEIGVIHYKIRHWLDAESFRREKPKEAVTEYCRDEEFVWPIKDDLSLYHLSYADIRRDKVKNDLVIRFREPHHHVSKYGRLIKKTQRWKPWNPQACCDLKLNSTHPLQRTVWENSRGGKIYRSRPRNRGGSSGQSRNFLEKSCLCIWRCETYSVGLFVYTLCIHLYFVYFVACISVVTM